MTPSEHAATIPSSGISLLARLRGLLDAPRVGGHACFPTLHRTIQVRKHALAKRTTAHSRTQLSPRRLALGPLCAALSIVALSATPAQALKTHEFLGSFTGSEAPTGAFADPNGVAVVESGHEPGEAGDLYVADISKNLVDKLDASGSYLSQITGAGTPAKSFAFPSTELNATPAGVAVDNDPLSTSFSDLYVVDAGHGVIDKFDSSGKYVGQLTGTCATPGVCPGQVVPFETSGPFGVAVDTGGNVWVYESGGKVDEFDASGKFVTQFPTGCAVRRPSIAVDSSGDTYVNCANSIEKFSPTGISLGALPNGGSDITVAVDQADNHAFETFEGREVLEFDATGASISEFNVPGGIEATPAGGLAVDGASGDVYMSDQKTGAVYHWGPLITLPDVTTGEASAQQPTSATLNGAVNPAGVEVTACQFEYGTSTTYGQTVACAQKPGSGAGEVPVTALVSGLQPSTTYHFRLTASNKSGASQGQDQAFTTTGPPSVDEESSESVAQTSATLQAQVNPHGFDTTYHFEYGTTAGYGTSVPIPAGDIGAGTTDEVLSAELIGLHAGVTYHYRVVAVNSQGTTLGFDELFTTMPAARIEGVAASNVTASSGTLEAQINPLSNATTYRFEYGTSTAYGTNIPITEASIGSGSTAVAVSQDVSGLQPNTTYHYRVVAHNSLGIASSPDHTFIYDESGVTLPDNRAYEMVTPPQKNGALIGGVPFGPPLVVSEDGSRVILGVIQCFGAAESCPVIRGPHVGTPYAFSRTTGGWVANPLAPPATQFATSSWWLSSPDAGTALFSAPTAPHGEDDFYARQADGSLLDIGPLSPPSAGPSLVAVTGDHEGYAATADLSHVLYATEPLWPFSQSKFAERYGSLFEYTRGSSAEPVLVGVSGGNGSTDLISACSTHPPAAPGEGELSADGRVVYFTSEPVSFGQACPSGTGANKGKPVPVEELYARVESGEPNAHTVAISEPKAPQTLASTPPDNACLSATCQGNITNEANWRAAVFAGASSDGSRAFFTSSQQLTDTASEDLNPKDTLEGCFLSPPGQSGCNLYSYEDVAGAEPSQGRLTDVSAGDTSGHGPRVQGVMAVSTDGSHVYFVAKGVLTVTPNDQGQHASQEQDNLYVYTAGHVAFIAILPPSDIADWETIERKPNVTPDGRFLVFTSSGALTPDATRSDGGQQVFRYDDRSGQLVRISIGEQGFNDNGNGGAGNASIVAGFHGYQRAGVGRSDPTMSHDGAYVFFMSPVALTGGALKSVKIATDLEGSPAYAQNVYEYHEGHVYLISDGRDTAVDQQEACAGSFSSTCLIGTDAAGRNVFFSTADQLAQQDTDTQLDFYDARICAPKDPCIQPQAAATPPCLDEASCHGSPPTAPSQSTPGSASFDGPGNPTQPPPSVKKPLTKAQKLARALKACRAKHNRHQRTTCEKAARKRYGPRSKHASTNRRGK